MATLTLTFKDRTLLTRQLEEGEVRIGRDNDNDIQIDSLAVAPHHSLIKADDGILKIRQLDDHFPLFINGEKFTDKTLVPGDCVSIGKHLLFISMDKPVTPPTTGHVQVGTTGVFPARAPRGVDATLQMLNGKKIGLVVPIRTAMTRLGRDDAGSAVISRREDGYFLSTLAGGEWVKLNDEPIGDETCRLKSGDVIAINDHLMQFHCMRES